MLGRRQPAGKVGRADAGDLSARQAQRIDDHQRQTGPGQPGEVALADVVDDVDDGPAAGRRNPPDPGGRSLDLGTALVAGTGADGDGHARLGGCVQDALQDLHPVARLPTVKDQLDRGLTVRGASRRLRPAFHVLVLLQQRLHPSPGRRAHVGAPVQHLGDRRHRHTGRGRHGGERRGTVLGRHATSSGFGGVLDVVAWPGGPHQAIPPCSWCDLAEVSLVSLDTSAADRDQPLLIGGPATSGR